MDLGAYRSQMKRMTKAIVLVVVHFVAFDVCFPAARNLFEGCLKAWLLFASLPGPKRPKLRSAWMDAFHKASRHELHSTFSSCRFLDADITSTGRAPPKTKTSSSKSQALTDSRIESHKRSQYLLSFKRLLLQERRANKIKKKSQKHFLLVANCFKPSWLAAICHLPAASCLRDPRTSPNFSAKAWLALTLRCKPPSRDFFGGFDSEVCTVLSFLL